MMLLSLRLGRSGTTATQAELPAQSTKAEWCRQTAKSLPALKGYEIPTLTNWSYAIHFAKSITNRIQAILEVSNVE
jgi:hypothetical protein